MLCIGLKPGCTHINCNSRCCGTFTDPNIKEQLCRQTSGGIDLRPCPTCFVPIEKYFGLHHLLSTDFILSFGFLIVALTPNPFQVVITCSAPNVVPTFAGIAYRSALILLFSYASSYTLVNL